MMAPGYEETAKTLALKAMLIEGKYPRSIKDLGGVYGIHSIPTMIIFKGYKRGK